VWRLELCTLCFCLCICVSSPIHRQKLTTRSYQLLCMSPVLKIQPPRFQSFRLKVQAILHDFYEANQPSLLTNRRTSATPELPSISIYSKHADYFACASNQDHMLASLGADIAYIGSRTMCWRRRHWQPSLYYVLGLHLSILRNSHNSSGTWSRSTSW
jgi:hypothetical protein